MEIRPPVTNQPTKFMNFPSFISAIVIALAGALPASADTNPTEINVPNGSFETSAIGGGWTYTKPDIISDWTFDAPAGSAYGQLWNVFFNSPGSSSGGDCAFIDNDSPGEEARLTSADSLGTILADTTYTLTVAVGNADINNPGLAAGPFDFDPIADTPSGGVSLALLADGQPFAIDSIPVGLVASGTWQDFSLSYTTTDADPVIGEKLTIQLGTDPGAGSTQAAAFDNVRLDTTSVSDGDQGDDGDGNTGGGLIATPEPSSSGLLGLSGFAFGCFMRWKRLNSEFAS
jgi:hypothetical protein